MKRLSRHAAHHPRTVFISCSVAALLAAGSQSVLAAPEHAGGHHSSDAKRVRDVRRHLRQPQSLLPLNRVGLLSSGSRSRFVLPLAGNPVIDLTWDNVSGVWSDATHWTPPDDNFPNRYPNNGVDGFDYNATIGGGTVTLDGTYTVNNFTLAGGTLTDGNATLTLTANDLISLSGGTITGATGLVSGSDAGDGLVFAGTNTTLFLQGTVSLTNKGGAGGITGGNTLVYGFDSVQLINATGATFTVSGNGSFVYANGAPLFSNDGTFIKNSDAGVLSMDWAFDNAGSVSVQTGTLSLSRGGQATGSFSVATGAALAFTGGIYTLNTGAQLNGAGAYNLTNGTLAIEGAATGNATLSQSGGVITSASGATFTEHAFNFSGGTVTGSVNLATGTGAGDGLLFSGTNSTTFIQGSATLTNKGGAGGFKTGDTSIYVYGYDNAQIVNAAGATFTVSGEGNFVYANGAPLFTNAGAFTKNTDTGTLAVDWAFDNTGSVSVQTGTLSLSRGGQATGSFSVATGAALAFTGGIYTLNTGAQLNGAGAYNLTNGTLAIEGAATGNATLSQSGGVITSSSGSTLTLNRFDLSGGTVTGQAQLVTGTGAGDGLLFSGTNSTTFIQGSATLTNKGGAGGLTDQSRYVYGYDNAHVTNALGATFTVSGNGNFVYANGAPLFSNYGVFVKNTDAGLLSVDWAFDNVGSVSVQTGTLSLSRGGQATGSFSVAMGAALAFTGGTYTLNTGAQLNGAGAYNLTNGTLAIEGTATGNATLSQSGGIITSASSGTLSLKRIDLTGGTVTGSALVASNTGANAGLVFSGDNSVSYVQGTASLTNKGGAGGLTDQNRTVYGYDNAHVTNATGATFTVSGNGGFYYANGVPLFSNDGAFVKNTDSGLLTMGWAFDNAGSVSVQTGTLSLTGGGSAAGTFAASTGATLNFGGGTYALNDGAQLNGLGSINLTSGTLALSGNTTGTSTLTLTGGTITSAADGTLTDHAISVATGQINGSAHLQSGTGAGDGVRFDGANPLLVLLNNATLTNRGGSGSLNGSTIVYGYDNASFTNAAGATFTASGEGEFYYANGSPSFTNAGTFIKDTSANSLSVTWTNFSNTGSISVRSGTLTLNTTIAQYDGVNQALTAGTWEVSAIPNGSSATLNGNGFGPITTLAAGASVALRGVNSAFPAVDSLNLNNGNFTVSNARSFTVSAPGQFINNGQLAVLSGATFTATGGLTVNGAATINAATINGPVTIAGTLLGTGTVNGAVQVNGGGILAAVGPNTTPTGVLTLTDNLTLSASSVLEFVLGASGAHSTLTRSGSGGWSFAGTQLVSFLNAGATPGFYDNLITGLAGNPLLNSNFVIANGNLQGYFSYDGTGDIDLTLTAVPEPATWLGAGLCALAAVGRFARQRRRNANGQRA